MTIDSEIIEGLNDLLTKNYDSEAGYKNALENTESLKLKAFFKTRTDQRCQFGHEIKELIKSLGGTPKKGTSLAGDAHRVWIDFKTALSFEKEEAILEECERGEEYCLAEYDEFLSEHILPSNVKTVITDQRNKVANSIRRVEELEEALEN